MKRTLYFDYTIKGHHVEYIHHLYEAAGKISNEEFIFAVPLSFTKASINFEWKKYTNIEIFYIDEKYLNKIKGNFLKRAFISTIELNRVAKRFKATDIFLISLMSFIPFLPLIMNSKIKISGIIYQIYLYKWKENSLLSKILDVLKYLIMSKCRIFDNIFILNDKSAPKIINRVFSTNKFKFLPDPIIKIRLNNKLCCKEFIDKKQDKKIIFHFGVMTRSKGTLNILKSIELFNKDYNIYTFVFAGLIEPDIKEDFYGIISSYEGKYSIKVFDQYCTFELLDSILKKCDAILCPYERTYQSSGVIGYAAQYKKPVIVPKSGLLGKIVKTYKLGILIDDNSPKEIYNGVLKINNWTSNDKYMYENTVENFTAIINSLN